MHVKHGAKLIMTRAELYTNLVPALLQQPFNKFPVSLSDDRRRQVGQFGLSDGRAQVPGLLDVLLIRYREHSLSNHQTLQDAEELSAY